MEQVKISELNIKDVADKGAIFDVLESVVHPNFETDRRKEHEQYVETVKRFIRSDCLNYGDDDQTINPQESFQLLASKMTNLIQSGKIKKRIVREGYGDCPKNSTTVKIQYNAYTEHDCIPFDSTYARNEPCFITIGDNNVIRGLEIAVQSMKINEKAEFLIDPEYAYKNSGLNRIKPNSVVLFEIEMFDIQSTTITNDDEINDFDHVYKLCNELRVKGNLHFKNENYNGAIDKYKKAVEKLEDAVLRDMDDQEKCEELLIKLHTNLLVCYTKLELPKKGCLSANKIFYLAVGKNVSAKVLYNQARCLKMLGDYKSALRKMRIVKKMEPQNEHITKEIAAIEKAEQDAKKRDAIFGRVLLSSDI